MANSYQERSAKAHIPQYLSSSNYHLGHVYDNYSQAKYNAWEYCEHVMEKFDGYSLKVITYNSQIFTAGFTFVDKETGVLKFYYITPHYDVIVDL